MNICVIGTGYVGLVAGTGLSDFGMNVTCIDKDENKIAALKRGEVPIYELGLRELIERNVKLERLHFSTDLEEAVDRCLVIFLALGTPEMSDGSVDMRDTFEVVERIARCMKEYKIIAVKSTVPVGTAREIRRLIKDNLSEPVEFDVVSNPEFLRQGAAVEDFMRPNRVILGSDSARALAIMHDIYRPLYLLETPVINTTNETAELIKYAANTMLAMKISYINEIANLCDKAGADVFQVARALGMDNRIGPKFLHPGPGFGGSCFPKDVKGLLKMSENLGYDFKIARAILEVNSFQRDLVLSKAKAMLGGSFQDKVVCLLGLAFKPNTDDIRESPALHVASRLLGEKVRVQVYDPAAMDNTRRVLPDIAYFSNAYDAAGGADLIIIMTEWNEFRDLSFSRLKDKMRSLNIFDTRNLYNPATIKEKGFRYLATGRN